MSTQIDFFSDLDLDESTPDFFSDIEEFNPKKQPSLKKSTSEPVDFFEGLETPSSESQPSSQQGLVESFQRGLEESASGKFGKQLFDQGAELKQRAESDPTFWEDLVKEAGTITGDLPYMAAGGTLGAILGGSLGSVVPGLGTGIGATIGGGAGAFALPAFLKQALTEYRDFQESGGDLTFGDFLDRADRIASRTLNEGLFGTILGSVKKAMPLLKKTPGIGKMFSSKFGETAGLVGAEAATATIVPALAERRLPEGKDFAKATALILGLKAAELPSSIANRLQRAGEASGKSPEQFAKELPPEELAQIQEEIDASPTLEIEQTTEAPLVETTGEGAQERIAYPEEVFDRLIEKANEFIQEAKTPKEGLKRLGQKTNTAIFNSLAPLERIETNMELPISERVSTRIKLAQSSASEINSVLENGIFSNMTGNFEHQGLKGAYGDLTWKKLSKGLQEGEYSLQDLDAYRTSKISLKRQAEGKKTGIDTKKAKEDIGRLAKKYEPIDRRIRDFQKATLNHYGKDLLGDDLIAKWSKDYYSPLYRVMESGKDSILKTGALTPKQPFKKFKGSERTIIPPSESDPYNAAMLISNSRKNDSILQYRKLVEEGKLPGKIKSSKNNPIPQEVQDVLEIDPELKKVAESLYNQTRKEAFTPEQNILRGWKDGKPFTIEVPEEIYNVFSSIAPQERSPLAKIFSATNRLFSKSVSMAPRKFLSIFGRDALSSLIYSRTGNNPISVVEALSDIYNAKPVYKEFLAMGGDVYASRLAERIDRAKRIEDLITPGKEGILVPFEKIGDYFRKYGEALQDISLAVPLGEYKRALAKYGNTAEGRIMAAMEARRVTYDPTRKGGWKVVRELGNYIPFWNVSLQDISSLGRNLRDPTTWVKGITAISLPTILLKMTNEGNPEYEELTPIDKAAFWHLYFGDNHIRIPIPWLLGTAFKVSSEAFYDTAMELAAKGDPRAKDAWKGLYQSFVENLSGDLPPLLSNYIEMTTGKSAASPLGLALGVESRAPEVVPRRLQDLPPSLQYTSRTSQLARKFGQMWGISPVKLERTIKNFGTQVASDMLALTDEIAYATGLAEDKRPEQREANYLLLGNFISKSPPSRTKYANEFYEYLREATQDRNAQKVILEKGITDTDLDRIEYADVPIFSYNRRISKLFRDMRAVEDSNLSSNKKKLELDKIQREINSLYKEVVTEVRIAKKRKKE